MTLLKRARYGVVWVAAVLASLCVVTLAQAEPDGEAPFQRIKQAVEAHTHGDVKVDKVRTTPMEGVFEVTTLGMDLFYVNTTGRYGLIDGRMVTCNHAKT
jgi:hypothetical protein